MTDTLKPSRKYQHIYAIIRYVINADERTPIDLRVSVTKVVNDGNYANMEVHRLNELNKDKACYYFSQITRFEEVAIRSEELHTIEMNALESQTHGGA